MRSFLKHLRKVHVNARRQLYEGSEFLEGWCQLPGRSLVGDCGDSFEVFIVNSTIGGKPRSRSWLYQYKQAAPVMV